MNKGVSTILCSGYKTRTLEFSGIIISCIDMTQHMKNSDLTIVNHIG